MGDASDLVFWTIRAETLSDSMRKMAQEFLGLHAPGHDACAILHNEPIEARGSGTGIMRSKETLVLAALAEKLPEPTILLADDDGILVTLETIRSEWWIHEFEELAIKLGIINPKIRWNEYHHPADIGGWF
jgi:hypothetical protein